MGISSRTGRFIYTTSTNAIMLHVWARSPNRATRSILVEFHTWRSSSERCRKRATPKRYSAEFKARVALDAVKGLKTVNELASTYGVHPTQITHWKHQLQKEVPDIFSARRDKRQHDQEAFQAQLYQQIGQLKVELDWLKKKAGLAT